MWGPCDNLCRALVASNKSVAEVATKAKKPLARRDVFGLLPSRKLLEPNILKALSDLQGALADIVSLRCAACGQSLLRSEARYNPMRSVPCFPDAPWNGPPANPIITFRSCYKRATTPNSRLQERKKASKSFQQREAARLRNRSPGVAPALVQGRALALPAGAAT